MPINTIVHTKNSLNDEVYAGADIGVFYHDNIEGSWTPFLTNLPNSAVRDLEIYFPTKKLRAGTYGRGVWETNITPILLPVELSKFVAQQQGENSVLLRWASNSETNLKNYEVEMSTDGKIFENISTHKGRGNSTTVNNYESTVNDLKSGLYYFRLKMNDINGQYSYSQIAKVTISSRIKINAYPNPVSDLLTLSMDGKLNGKTAVINITTIEGKVIYSKNLLKINKTETLDLTDVPSGTYYLNVSTNNNEESVIKIIVQH